MNQRDLKVCALSFLNGAHSGPLVNMLRLDAAIHQPAASTHSALLGDGCVAATFFAKGVWHLLPASWREHVKNRVWHMAGRPGTKQCRNWADGWTIVNDMSKGYALAPLLAWAYGMALSGTLAPPSFHEFLAAALAFEMMLHLMQRAHPKKKSDFPPD